MMEILVFSNMYPSEMDPTYGTFVKIFCDGMEREGFSVDRVMLKGRSGMLAKVLKYLRFSMQLIGKYLLGRHDLVYVHYILHLSFFLLPLHMIRRRRIVLNVHGGDILPRNALHRVLFWFARRLAKRADAVVVPSHYFKGVAIRQLGIESDMIKVWGSSGVDLDRFKPAKEYRRPDLNSLELLCVGRLDPRKGWKVLLEALAGLRGRKEHRFRLTLVGHGSPTDQRNLHMALSSMGLEECCTYAGACTHEELPMGLQAADLFVFPTLYEESLGLVALEAMACGIPVIGSRIGALPEYIREGQTGFLFEPGNADALGAALEKASIALESRDQELRRECLEEARLYDRTALEREMANWLSELTGEARK